MELANRAEIEKRFGRKLGLLTGEHRRELVGLLGSPPNVLNVPGEFWTRVQREIEEELLAALLLIFIASATQHGADQSAALLHGRQWAANRAREVGKSWTDTTRDRLNTAQQSWTTTEPTKTEVIDVVVKIFGPDRVEAVVVSETTSGASAGSEWGVEVTIGKDEQDTWYTVRDRKVCPICEPLHKKPRSEWARLFPFGPPCHPRCRCWIEYAAEKGQPNRGEPTPVGV